MEITPHIFDAKVMHKRLTPRENTFSYRIYYLLSPQHKFSALKDSWRFGVNQSGLMSLYEKDHVNPQNILQQYHLHEANGEIIFMVMPRILGYGFNPVCFWFCLDKQHQLRAVLAEVHNTFGEHHSYVVAHKDHRPLLAEDTLIAQKVFHVSPFMQREGTYRFRFDYRPQDKLCGIWIDYDNAQGSPMLITSLIGKLLPYNRKNRRRIFWQIPFLSLRVMALIHWQAIKLLLKRISYVPKPLQHPEKVSATTNLTKSSYHGNYAVNIEEIKIKNA